MNVTGTNAICTSLLATLPTNLAPNPASPDLPTTIWSASYSAAELVERPGDVAMAHDRGSLQTPLAHLRSGRFEQLRVRRLDLPRPLRVALLVVLGRHERVRRPRHDVREDDARSGTPCLFAGVRQRSFGHIARIDADQVHGGRIGP